MAPQLSNIHLPQLRVGDFEVLSDWDFDGVGKTFSAKVPGYRPTSTFLTTLRSNLQLSTTGGLSPSLSPSTISTPTAPAFSTTPYPHNLPGPSPLAFSTLTLLPAAMSSTPETPPQQDCLPELKYTVAPTTPPADRIEALKLIADSIAQQRQIASRAVILHPVTLALAAIVLAILARLLEFYALITTSAGLTMILLLAVRWYTAGYIPLAESIGFKWLEETTRPRSNSNGGSHGRSGSNSSNNSNGGGNGNGSSNRDPIVLVAKWGDEVIGALVLRVIKRERKGYVRAWTTKLRYRHRGVGRGLLEEGAKIVWGKGGRGMLFEAEHANAGRVLPQYFNAGFERNEERAREMLAEVVSEIRRERSSR